LTEQEPKVHHCKELDLYVLRLLLMDAFCMRGKEWLTKQLEAPMQDVEQRKYLSVSFLAGHPQKRILNTPNRLTHGRKQSGSMPLNDNTVAHGFAK